MKFYDLYMTGDDFEGILEVAKRMEFEGIGLVKEFENKESLDGFIEEVEELREGKDVDLVISSEIQVDSPKEMKKEVSKVREKVEVVMVRGGDFNVNKAAVGDSRVDVLAQPEYNRKDSGMDHKTAKAASQNDVAIGIVLHPLIMRYGKVRSHILNHIKKNLSLCKEYDATPLIMSGARGKYEMRDPRELASLPKVLGFNPNDSMEMVSSNPAEIVEENRKKLEGKIRKDGVEEIH